MANKIDLLKFYFEAEKEKASEKSYEWRKDKYIKNYHYERGRYDAFSDIIQTLGLLYNSENENGGKNDASNDGKPM